MLYNKASLVPVLEPLIVGIDGGKVEKVHKGQPWRAWVGLSSCHLQKSLVRSFFVYFKMTKEPLNALCHEMNVFLKV
jgi:hypothetical protein